MSTLSKNWNLIEKENISKLNFTKDDVLNSNEEVEKRRKRLQSAVQGGNNHKAKVLIVFEDDQALKAVETTVWGLTDKHIILKGSINLPIHRIHSIV